MPLYLWGAGNHGQLGLGDLTDRERPAEVQLVANQLRDLTPDGLPSPTAESLGSVPNDICQITGGGAHTLFVTTSNCGDVYVSGSHAKGQLGVGDSVIPLRDPGTQIFVRVSIGGNERIRKIAAGWEHTLVLTTEGKVYGWGHNGFGQLGLSDKLKVVSVPEILPIESPIVDIAAGLRHSVVVDVHGKVMAVGKSAASRAMTWQEAQMHPLTGLLFQDDGKRCSVAAEDISNNHYHPMHFDRVACGQHHVVVYSSRDARHMAVMGNDRFGQCCGLSGRIRISGLEQDEAVKSSTEYELSVEEYESTRSQSLMQASPNRAKRRRMIPKESVPVLTVVRTDPTVDKMVYNDVRWTVNSGWSHLVRCDGKTAWTWGRGDFGQLGRGLDSDNGGTRAGLVNFSPMIVPVTTDLAVQQSVAGSEHTLLLTNRGLYACGWNEHGNCGTGDTADVRTPTLVTNVEIPDISVAVIGAGMATSMAFWPS
eukprot:Clim_evm39s158 gene=Clim_evmTU39s158